MSQNWTAIEVPPGIARMADHFCGCGNPESAWEVVRGELERISAGHVQPVLDDGYWYIMAYLLDHCDLTEHGSSIRGAWLNDDGKIALAFLKQYGCDWQESKVHEFFTHTPDGEMCVGGGK